MSAITESLPSPSMETLEQIRSRVHPSCVVCGCEHPFGLKMKFQVLDDGRFRGTFDCTCEYEGYSGRLQGGVVASLLDGVMTNSLFARGIVAVTVELTTRYRHPVEVGLKAELFSIVESTSRGLYLLKAELHQGGKLRAIGKGKFFVQPHLDATS